MQINQNWSNMIMNPYINAVKRIIIDLLGEKFTTHERLVETLAHTIKSDREYQELGSFLASLYEAGYIRAIEEHEKELKRLGFQIKIKKTENKPEEKHPLF